MDGYGLGEPGPGNAVGLAYKPNLDRMFSEFPNTVLTASGVDVGLPRGQIGNSEVGHMNIGAGRVVVQALPRISNAIAEGSFFWNPVYLRAAQNAKENDRAFHILGLLSNGGVHSHITHIYAMLELAKRQGLKKVCLHAFLDGRDVAPDSGAYFVSQLRDKCAELGVGRIATVQGRFYGMDRDKRWERVERGYNAIVCGEGIEAPDPVAAVKESYDKGVTDEFVEPIVCDRSAKVNPGDSVVFMNFRPDRARELTWAMTQPDFDGFPRKRGFFPVHFACTAQYDEALTSIPIAFPPVRLDDTLGEYISRLRLKQLRIAETEKYAHVTFFFNGGVEKVFPGEDRVLIPSPKSFPTYDLIPEMSAVAVTDECVRRIESGAYDFVICNLANCDMVGHTGVLNAAIKAVETVDACVGRIEAAASSMGGLTVITADHGNADHMIEQNGGLSTAHTTNPVPFIIVGADVRLRPGRLADIAPTLLDLTGIRKPEAMTGETLIIK